jgi:capsular polysaccharide transport system permease protein
MGAWHAQHEHAQHQHAQHQLSHPLMSETVGVSARAGFWRKPLFVWAVIVPMLLATVYYSFFALDRYESQAELVVRQPGGNPSAGAAVGLAMLVGGVNPTSREETLFLQAYISSNDMLEVLERELNWSSHYKGKLSDPLFWLSEQSAREDVLKFYRRVVKATLDETNGLLKISVEAYEPIFAQKVLRLIISQSQQVINELSRQMAREQLRFAQTELELARRLYEDKRQVLVQYQSSTNILDIDATALARATLINELEGQLVKSRAELAAMRTSLSPQSPQVQQKTQQIISVEQELETERQRLTSTQSTQGLNVIASQYRELMVDAAIAEEGYKFAVTAVENARIEATKQLRALLVVVNPNMPEDPTYPRRLYNLVALLIGLLMLYGILRFVVATINDHRD